VLAEVRKLVDDKKYPEATTAADKLSGAPSEVCNMLQIDIIIPTIYDELCYLLD
jgi:hypothetical protein